MPGEKEEKKFFERKNDAPKNSVELTEAQTIEAELNAIHNKLKSDEITIENAKLELKKINEWLQKKNIDQWYKEKISSAFDKLANNLEKNIKNMDEEKSKSEIKEIANLVHLSTNKQLARLKRSIQPTSERPIDVQQWIDESSKGLLATIHNAAKDQNPVAKKVWERMERLMS